MVRAAIASCMAFDELDLVRGLLKRSAHQRLKLGIGDDMAVVATVAGNVLLACDMSLDGVHFDTLQHSYQQIGRKAVARNLSDCAAMAVRPLAVTVGLVMPRKMSESQTVELFDGIHKIAAEFDLAIAGGDTTRWDGKLALDVAILAEAYPGIQPVERGGARSGDRLYVSGPLGGSILGKHLSFRPRVAEAKALAAHLGDRLHAMMDISDGLSLDLWRMCEASGVGAVLDAPMLAAATSAAATELALQDGRSGLDHALSDGEDFELLIAAEGEVACLGVALLPVGIVTESGLGLKGKDGRTEPLVPRGYIH